MIYSLFFSTFINPLKYLTWTFSLCKFSRCSLLFEIVFMLDRLGNTDIKRTTTIYKIEKWKEQTTEWFGKFQKIAKKTIKSKERKNTINRTKKGSKSFLYQRF